MLLAFVLALMLRTAVVSGSRVWIKHSGPPLRFLKAGTDANDAPCCCGSTPCVCNCGKLNEILQAAGSIKITVTDNNIPQQVTSSPDPIPITITPNPGGCVRWSGTADLTCNLQEHTFQVDCDDTSVSVDITPTANDNGCILTNIREISTTCNDITFISVWKADVVANPNGPDPPTCVAPCAGTEVTFTFEPI